jgi:hypothetical protein
VPFALDLRADEEGPDRVEELARSDMSA